jgi:hypothetical protein
MEDHERRFFAAWFVGGMFYMFLAAEAVADAGGVAIPFQVIIGAFFSIGVVGVAYVLGFVLAIPPLGRMWYDNRVIALLLIIAAFAVLFFDRTIGMAETIQLSDGAPYRTLHPIAGYGGMLAAVFGTLHFPRE